MADPQRLNVDKLILHHSDSPTWENKSKAEIAQWFSDTGFARGYSSNPANWSGLINPYTGERSYSMAHIAGQRVDGTTPDATDAERAAGYRIVPLIQDIWGQITWNAANWPVNQSCIGLENLGDYRGLSLRDGDMRVIADFWRPRDQALGGNTEIYGHKEVAQVVTECPANVLNARDQIVAYVNNPPQAAPAPEPIPVVPAPAPTPAPAPVAPAPQKPANTIYTKLGQPMDLVLNKNTQMWDLGFDTDNHAHSVEALAQGVAFRAYGKAQRTDNDKPAYFMREEDFGDADTSGIPKRNVGVNTVDLSPAPAPEPAKIAPDEHPAIPAAPAVPVITTPVATPAEPTATPVSPAPAKTDDGSSIIPVSIGSWQSTYQSFLNPVKFVATQNSVITEFDTSKPITPTHPASQQLIKGQVVMIAGVFSKGGSKYYRTANSAANGNWYAIPVTAIAKYQEPESVFDKIISEIEDEAKKIMHIK